MKKVNPKDDISLLEQIQKHWADSVCEEIAESTRLWRLYEKVLHDILSFIEQETEDSTMPMNELERLQEIYAMAEKPLKQEFYRCLKKIRDTCGNDEK